MWIKWKYVDHGFGDFKELEIPDDWDKDYESIPEYLCNQSELGIPTWGSRFMMGRIKWEKITLPPEEIKRREIARLKSAITYHEGRLKMYRDALQKII